LKGAEHVNVPPYAFKSKAMRALKGNWQTALLVSFFSALPMTVLQLAESTLLPSASDFITYEALAAAVAAVPMSTVYLIGVIYGLVLLVSPVLAVGCKHYFVRRIHRDELGFGGLFSRMKSFGKAFLLYLVMTVRTFLWSLLLIVPGIMAILRYSMAPFYLAENPELGVHEALNMSKQTMKGKKMSYFILYLSFVGWLLAAMLSELLLSDVSAILALVVSQFIQLYMATYFNAASASFYLAASVPDGMQAAQADANAWLNTVRSGMGAPGAPGDNDRGGWPGANRPGDDNGTSGDGTSGDGTSDDDDAPNDGTPGDGTSDDDDKPKDGD
jgi:uncharacterized membrane protein